MTIVVTVWDILCLISLGFILLCVVVGIIMKIVKDIKSKMFSKKHKEINKYDK